MITHLIYKLFQFITGKNGDRKWKEYRKEYLHNLTEEEKNILRHYLYYNTRSQNLNVFDGVVKGLIHSEVIYQASSIGTMRGGFACNIQPWAWEYLQKNTQLLSHQ
ncbi:super-infection exclusion protein B [Paenibacillus sp. HGF7]|uniref:super-infection exclusion protein B n=1 Tax=Paenibacillus sp. HGF7 TaxID=944559 RepID=UPI0014794981|nr:super-infection exclusion protein B [Paenibacillus sp. HGF7]